MRNEIFCILKSFDKKELQGFKKLLHSPFFNQNKKVISLFEEIHRHHPFYNSKNFDKHTLYQKIFSSNKYNESALKNLLL